MTINRSRKALFKGLSFVLVFSLLTLVGCDQSPSVKPSEQEQQDPKEVAVDNPELQKALKAQKKRGKDFLDRPGIVGVGSGLDEDGKAHLVVYGTTAKMVEKANLPSHANGVPVRAEITGLIVAGADETSRQRPAPVGFSIGHPDITAGTYGVRVEDESGNVYALSNNHILADANNASIGDNILQPGPTDGGTNPDDKIGELADYEPIDYSGTNTIDAAIASTTTSDLDFATSSEGYGTPGTSPVSASVGDNVQKYGRTTGLTKGEVSEVNVTVDVCFETNGPFSCSKSATFENQIGITPGDFSDGGDSGSLIVTDNSNANPVGLLFAGSDTRTLANPISDVLSRFNVSIDDGSGDGGSNSAPTASFTTNCTDLNCNFDGSGSSDSDGSIASYDWDFGDGTTATGQTASHTYGSDGTYTVTLTVTDDDGATDSQSQDVTVSSSTNSAPTASFTTNCTDLSCNFDGSGSSDSDGSISSYDWDFGDGTTATGQTASHTYGSGGTYTVTLTVTDDAGATDSQSQDVSVSSSTTFAVDSISPNSVAAGSSANVTITGSGFASGATVALENGSGPTPSVSNTTVVDATEITATISTKSGGPPRNRTWDVRVTNPDGTSDVLVGGFTVTP